MLVQLPESHRIISRQWVLSSVSQHGTPARIANVNGWDVSEFETYVRDTLGLLPEEISKAKLQGEQEI
jgi:hypothetical protein